MIYGYARVSTKGQEANGNSLESQVANLKANGCQEIIEESYTGTTADRPKFTELINKLNSGDMLVVNKLDRFARSTIQGCTIVEQLINKGVRVNILNMGVLDNTPASTLTRTIFFAFAQFERDMIVERTQEGKVIAKTKEGFREGRPKEYTQTQIDMALDLLEKHSYTEVEKMTKISKSTLTREMRKRKAKLSSNQ
jgi:DNA invertase Pin-like site-specific DNA recombinase